MDLPMHDLARRHLRPAGQCRVWPSSVFGHRSLVLENRWLRVSVLVDRGGLLYEVLWKPGDRDILWRWDRGLRPPSGPPPSVGLPQGGYQDSFVGGWDLMFPAVGRLVPVDGLPVGSHGEVWAMPWDAAVLQDGPDVVGIQLTAQCVRTPFVLRRTLWLRDEPMLECETEIVNRGATAAAYAIGEHAVWEVADLLADGGRIVLSGGEVRTAPEQPPGSSVRGGAVSSWPEVELVDGGRRDLSRLGPAERGTTALVAVTGTEGALVIEGGGDDRPRVELRWDAGQLPHLLLWLSYGGDLGPPWFGTTQLLGGEPISVLPWSDPSELPRLPPGERVRTTWRLRVEDKYA